MNNKQFTQKAISLLDKLKTDKNGFVTGKYRIQQSKAGGINFRHTESAAKSLIDGIRRNMTLNGSSVGFLPLSESLAKAKTIEDVMLDYRFNAAKEKLAIDAKTKQARIASLSVRIKKAYASLFGLSEKDVKSMNLSSPQVLQIVQASAAFFVRSTQKYVVPVKAVKVIKAAKKAKPVNAAKLKKTVRNAARPQVISA